MNRLQFVFNTTVSSVALYGYLNFNVQYDGNNWLLLYGDNKSLIINTPIETSDYTSLYRFALEEISKYIRSINGVVLYTTLDLGDPKLYTLLTTDIVVEIDSVNELTI
jgi:hypothetical protein